MAGSRMKFTKMERTNNPILRWIGNTAGNLSTASLMRAIYLDEEGGYHLEVWFHAKVWNLLHPVYDRWGTYYQGEFPKKSSKK